MTLFGRRAVVTVGNRKFESDHVVAGKQVLGFRIEFKVTQTLTSKTNTAEATVYNLSESTRNIVSDQRTLAIAQAIDAVPELGGSGATPTAAPTTRPQFLIEAGYEGQSGLIFKGYAERIEHARKLPGFETKINATDGSREGKQLVNKALAPGAGMADAIKVIADAMKASATRAIAEARRGDFGGAITSFANGLTLSGTTQAALDKLVQGQGIAWTITNGELVMLKKGAALPGPAVLLAPETGLVGAPERVTDKKRPKTLLFKVRSLLQAGLQPGKRVEMKSLDLKGSFVIETATHSGDTSGGAWFSELQLAEIKTL